MARAGPLFVLIALLVAGLTASGLPLLTPSQAEEPAPDRHDAQPGEWEQQVASDARGDVLVTYPGSIDLLYMTMGELFSVARMESFLFLRIGYDLIAAGNETLYVPSDLPVPGLPDPPPAAPTTALVMVNVSFVVNGDVDNPVKISLWSWDHGRNWASDQGLFLADNENAQGDREVIYVAPLRRFSLAPDDEVSHYDVSSYRNGRLVDTMQGFDPANDYLPNYVPVHPLLAEPGSVLPTSVGGVDIPPEVPEAIPGVPEEIREHVPNEPYPNVPSGLPVGIPKGTPHPDDLEEWDPDHDGPLPWQPEEIVDAVEGIVDDPTNGAAWNETHRIADGETRITVRTHRQVIGASITQVGFANFTVENMMKEHDQNVMLFFNGPPNTRWLLRYGLDMPQGVKTVPAGGRVEMNLITAPESLFSIPQWQGVAIFISDWGGLEVEPLIFVSTTERMEDPRALPGRTLILPDRLEIVLVNDKDHFRVNEPRQIMVRVRDADTGQFVSQLTAVRAYVYPAVAIPGGQPFQLREKPWMDGVYQIPYTFDRPGAWIIDVHFFDYPPGHPGGFPSEEFVVSVDLPGRAPPLMPSLAALASVALVVGAVWARERLLKAR